jgi:hypothetical protein
MKIDYIIFIITAFLIANTYYDGKFLKSLQSSQKYVKMATFAFIGLSIYLFVKKNPDQSRSMFMHANDIIKYMPVSKDTADIISPFLDFTNKTAFFGGSADGGNNGGNGSYKNVRFASGANGGGGGGGGGGVGGGTNGLNQKQNKVLSSGKTSTKRCVSETKKKFVAAQQGWKCNHCTRQLPAWYEVDHVVRLEHGGTNHIDNLVALCRDCHGKKTAIENL